MFSFFEKKIQTTVHTFFLFGLLCVAVGFITIFDEFFARALIAVAFFFVGFLFLYISYHLQEVKVKLESVFDAIKPHQCSQEAEKSIGDKKKVVRKTTLKTVV